MPGLPSMPGTLLISGMLPAPGGVKPPLPELSPLGISDGVKSESSPEGTGFIKIEIKAVFVGKILHVKIPAVSASAAHGYAVRLVKLAVVALKEAFFNRFQRKI